MGYILSMTSHTHCTLRRAQQGGHRGGGSAPNFFFWGADPLIGGPTHGFVHGFAHGFGVRWFSAPGIL